MSDPKRHAATLQKTLGLEIKAQVIERDRQLLHQLWNHVGSQGKRHKRFIELNRSMGLVCRISGKKFVSSIPAQHHFHAVLFQKLHQQRCRKK